VAAKMVDMLELWRGFAEDLTAVPIAQAGHLPTKSGRQRLTPRSRPSSRRARADDGRISFRCSPHNALEASAPILKSAAPRNALDVKIYGGTKSRARSNAV
jgi:hypothetical protein